MFVELTNVIELWKDSRMLHASSIDDNTQLELICENNQVIKGLVRKVQELSPLLFCKQVQLDQSEFTETGAIVNVNTSSAQYQTVNYYHTTMNMVRLCADEFVNAQITSSDTSRVSIFSSLYIFLTYAVEFVLFLAVLE